MNSPLLVLTLGLVATAVLFPGCSTPKTVNTVERAVPLAQRATVADKRIITDSSLNQKVRIIGLNQSTGAGGLLKVQVEVLNTTSSVQSFSYRWEWFDETGTIIETSMTTAVTRQIEGKESLFITGIAPKSTAKDFHLKLIEKLR